MKNETWYQQNRETSLEKATLYYQANLKKVAAQSKKWREDNPEKKHARDKKYREANKAKIAEYKNQYYHSNPEKVGEYQKKWRQNNPEKAAAYTERRYISLNDRTPAWANMTKIKAIYLERDRLNNEAGYIKYHVDHEIPIQGEFISGLHVENNLQILTATENHSKGNRCDNP